MSLSDRRAVRIDASQRRLRLLQQEECACFSKSNSTRFMMRVNALAPREALEAPRHYLTVGLAFDAIRRSSYVEPDTGDGSSNTPDVAKPSGVPQGYYIAFFTQ